jgi:hypothetical protein
LIAKAVGLLLPGHRKAGTGHRENDRDNDQGVQSSHLSTPPSMSPRDLLLHQLISPVPDRLFKNAQLDGSLDFPAGADTQMALSRAGTSLS